MESRRKKTRIVTYALTVLVLLSFSTLLVIAASSGIVRTAAPAATLTSASVMTAPILDGGFTDPAWAEATSITIDTAGGSGSISVSVKSVYTDTDLFFLVQWNDPTMSMTRGGSWNWDGTSWETTESSQSEDRVAFLWNINMSEFYSTGALAKCHPQYGASGAFLETPGETGDIWHMKAARSLGIISASQSNLITVASETHEVTTGTITMNGYMDDKYLSYEDPADLPEDGGRHGDSGSSTYGRNRNADKTGPLYLESEPTDYIDAMILKQSEVDGGETLEVATATSEQITDAWNKYAQLGAVVPERILREPSGSRGDLIQSATWSDGTWTTEIKRALVTKTDGVINTDDVQFTDLTATYGFSLSVMDNAGGDKHSSTGTTVYDLAFGEEVIETTSETVSELFGFNAMLLLFALGAIIILVAAYRRRRKV